MNRLFQTDSVDRFCEMKQIESTGLFLHIDIPKYQRRPFRQVHISQE